MDQKPLLYAIKAHFVFPAYSKVGELENKVKEIKQEYNSISKAFFIPEPTFKFYETVKAPDDAKIEITSTCVIFNIQNCTYSDVRFFEDLFRLVAQHKRDILSGGQGIEYRFYTYNNPSHESNLANTGAVK